MGNPQITALPVDAQYTLAKAWLKKGVHERALAGFRQILEENPGHAPAAQALGDFLLEHGRFTESAEVYRRALEFNPNQALLHKGFVSATVAGPLGIDEAFRHYQLVPASQRKTCIPHGEVVVCLVLRNERQRLPFFLQYYRGKGIETFIAVDNGSTDGSAEYLAAQPGVFLWQSPLSFNKANFGAAWFEPILRKHAQGRWVLIVDADELFYYPGCEQKSIPALCAQLDRHRKRAFNAILLDMYSDLPLAGTRYLPGVDFRETCPYFDRRFYHRVYENAGQFRNQRGYSGGARERVFGPAGEYYLSKVPLMRYDADCVLTGGQHCTNLPLERIASASGCLLHFKYFSSFHDYVSQESARGEHFSGAMQYREYQRGLAQAESFTLFDPEHSLRLRDSAQLVELGIMNSGAEDAEHSPVVEFPAVRAVPAGGHRPFWSVMITAYRRSEFLKQCLESVLQQDTAIDDMQIEVVSDGPDHPVQDEIEAIVRSVAGGRVPVFRNPGHAGHPGIFNVCLDRARGQWIHLLHDDDWLAPEFYRTLGNGIAKAPEVGAAFCRHMVANEHGEPAVISWLERESAGVIPDWIHRIGLSCRLQTPSIVVSREAYERVGGYCPQAKSAFDWEMWQRLAVHYPVWFEPKPLAFFREHEGSESTLLVTSGRQIADTFLAIEIAHQYLPENVRGTITSRAREVYALYALRHARKHLEAGKYEAAWANVHQALHCSDSEKVRQVLLALVKES